MLLKSKISFMKISYRMYRLSKNEKLKHGKENFDMIKALSTSYNER